MYDTHYDLLTYLYMADKRGLTEYMDNLDKYFNDDNVKGVIANLYFMNNEEMKEKFDLDNIDVVEMFKKSKELLDIKSDYLLSIEGCDYIKDEEELETLYNLGLDTFLLTWNNPNKYGSGPRNGKGLTYDGYKFIKRAIDLGMGIDLSHANTFTFEDIIDVIKHQDKEVNVYASHSNIGKLYGHPRNLSDDELDLLKSVNGKLGIVAYPPFLTNNDDVYKAYVNHIKYAVNKLGIDNVMLASDNMVFDNVICNREYEKPLFEYETMKKDIEKILLDDFSLEETNKIMKDNAKTLFKSIKNNHR